MSARFRGVTLQLAGWAATVASAAALGAAKLAARAPTEGEKDAFVKLAMRSGGLPGLQTVVMKGGRVVWMKSYGYAVLDQPGPAQLMRNDSILFSASVAKELVRPWALQGLTAALEAQGRRADAAVTATQFKRAWRNADVSLTFSVF